MRTAFAALLLFASVGLAQPPAIPAAGDAPARRAVQAGDTVAVAEGRFADVKVDVPAGASVVWRFYPPPPQKAADLAPGRAIFAGEPGKVYVVTAVVIDFDKKSVVDTEFAVEFAGKVPAPPAPDPTPKPEPPAPKPPAPPAPEPVTSFKVLLVYESGATHTAAQKAVLEGKVVEEWLTANCTGGKAGWGRRDKDADPAADTTPIGPVWAAAKPGVTSTPALFVAVNEKVAVIDPFPATPAEAVRVLDKYRGGK